MWTQLGVLASCAAVGIQFVLFLRWLHRRYRDDEINRECVRQMATVHLPLIYKTLLQLANGEEVTLEVPPIHFVELNGRRAS